MDRRARYTRDVLKKSLLELMKHQPFQKITVKALCAEADLNRATFYSHYESIEDLLAEIENEFSDTVKAALTANNRQFDINTSLVKILETIIEQRELCRVLISPYGNKDFLESLIQIAYKRTSDEYRKRFVQATPAQIERTFAFYSHGSVNVIAHWIKCGMKESPEELARFIIGLSEEGLRSLRPNRMDRRGPAT